MAEIRPANDVPAYTFRYACTFFGWLVAAFSNSTVTQYLDLGFILDLGAVLQIMAQVMRTWLPPLPLFAVTFFLASLGQAFNDTHANIFVSSLQGAHRYLGFIHAMYMAGCLVGPLIATSVSSANTPSMWNLFYIFPLGIGVVNLVFVSVSFRDRYALLKRATQGTDARNSVREPTRKAAIKEIKATLSTPSVWLLSLFFFFFLGATITAGGILFPLSCSEECILTTLGWMVDYLQIARNGDPGHMGYVLTGFYGGAFLGRLALAEPTYRFGERRMVFIYALLCVGLQLVFWLWVPILSRLTAAANLS